MHEQQRTENYLFWAYFLLVSLAVVCFGGVVMDGFSSVFDADFHRSRQALYCVNLLCGRLKRGIYVETFSRFNSTRKLSDFLIFRSFLSFFPQYFNCSTFRKSIWLQFWLAWWEESWRITGFKSVLGNKTWNWRAGKLHAICSISLDQIAKVFMAWNIFWLKFSQIRIRDIITFYIC